MTSVDPSSRRPPRQRASFETAPGKQGPPGDPRLLLADLEEGQVPSKGPDGTIVPLTAVDQETFDTALESVASGADLEGFTSLFDGAELGPGFDVVIVAGQSNASGRGLAVDTARLDVSDGRIWQWASSGAYAGIASLAVEPLTHHDNGVAVGPGLEFARQHVLAASAQRRVLIVPVAHGATGFDGGTAGYTWTPDSVAQPVNLYANLVAQANAAIAAAGAYGTTRVLAVLWNQGEDNTAMTASQYAAQLDTLINRVRTDVTGAGPTTPFIVGEMVPEWWAANSTNVNSAHRETPSRRQYTAFARGITGANQDSLIHYNAIGARAMGRSMYRALARARANHTGSAPVAPSNVALSQSSTSLTVTWDPPVGRATDYLLEYKTAAASSWTTFAHTASVATTQTITGLTLGTTYDVRVSTVNEDGTSAPTATATLAMASLPGQVTGLAAGTPTPSAVPLTWTAVAGATSYVVERRTPAGSGSYTTLQTVTTNSASGIGLSASTQYGLRVTAVNAAGSGTPSTEVTATTANPAKLLDDVGVAAFRALGVRKLSSNATYSGPCLRVRYTNGTEADIGFAGNDDLDTTTLLAGAAANGGGATIVTWYDQSGNGRNVTIATVAQQPTIVSSNTLVTSGGKAALSFDGVDDRLIGAATGLWAAAGSSVLAVAKTPVFTSGNQALFGEAGTAARYVTFLFGSNKLASQIRVDGGSDLHAAPGSVVFADGAIHQLSIVDSGSAMRHYVDGASSLNAAYTRGGATLTLTSFAVGLLNISSPTYFGASTQSEIVQFTTALSDGQRAAGAANQRVWFNTPTPA